MWWLLCSLVSVSIALPLQGFPSHSLNVDISETPSSFLHQPLVMVPGIIPPQMMVEPLETTTKDHPGRPSLAPLPLVSAVDKVVDLNSDGQLSLPEVQYAAFVHHGLSASVVKSLFDQVDSDRDGILSFKEFNEIKPLVLEKAENAALRYLQSVDTDHNKMLSLKEAQTYLLKEYGIGHRDVERIWRLVNEDTTSDLTSMEFSKLRRRIRGMTIRLARQIMKTADSNGDGHISLDEAQAIAFEQEGIQAGDVTQMMASVDDNQDGELNAPEFADFERIVRARSVDTSKKALKVVDADGSGTVTMDEAKRIAFEHYGFDEEVLGPFFDQADEDENGHLDPVEFAGFRTVIRARAVRNAIAAMSEVDLDGDGLVNFEEAAEKTKAEDDMEPHETKVLFNIADQNKSGKLDKVEFADFLRLVRLSAIRFAADHFKEFDRDGDGAVAEPELAQLIQSKYNVPPTMTAEFFREVDVDDSKDLIPAEIVDFRHVIRKFVSRSAASNSAESSGDGEDLSEEQTRVSTEHRAPTPSQVPNSIEEQTTRRKVAFYRKPTTSAPTTTTTSTTTTTTTQLPNTVTTVREQGPTTKRRAVWRHWNKTTTTEETPTTTANEAVLEERKRIIEKQKKELNIPEDAEVEYLDGDATTKSPEEYEVVEYEEGGRR